MDTTYKKRLDDFLESHNFEHSNVYCDKLYEYLKNGFCEYDAKKTPGFMINSKVAKPKAMPKSKSAVVVDVGGTNVRRSVVSFDDAGEPSLSHLEKVPFKDLLEGKDFFISLASFISPLLLETGIDNIALCFSFPFTPTDDSDAVVSGSAKGLDVSQFKGKKILESLKKELNKSIDRPLSMSIVNDATSLLLYLSLVEKDRDSVFVASIVGTGTNCCFYSKHDELVSDNNYYAICSEVGHFNMDGFKLSDFDYIVDEKSEHPGSSMIEILTSGFYLYKVFRELIKTAIEDGVFSELDEQEAKKYVSTINDTKDIDRAFTMGEGISYLADLFVNRASYTVKAMLNAAVAFSSNFEPRLKTSVLIEGSTYYLLPRYKEKTEAKIKDGFYTDDVKVYYPLDNKGTVVLYGAALSAFK